MNFLFDTTSKRQPNPNLMEQLSALNENRLNSRYVNWDVGCLQYFENHWFEYVPLFIGIQKHVYDYNMRNAEEWLAENEASKDAKKIKNRDENIRKSSQ